MIRLIAGRCLQLNERFIESSSGSNPVYPRLSGFLCVDFCVRGTASANEQANAYGRGRHQTLQIKMRSISSRLI